MMRVADYIIERLYDEGAKHIFMVTGRGNLYLSDAVAKHPGITGICVHHEQAGSFAAMAYAQWNGKLGACLVSTGCAGTNAITGLLCAWQDDVPCIFISGQNILNETSRYTGIPLRTYGQQEANIARIVEPITKYSTMITKADQIAIEMDKALYIANTGRKGPVWIDVPLDIQNMRVEPNELKRFVHGNDFEFIPSKLDVESVAIALKKAQHPVLLIGSGIRSAGAIEELKLFIEEYPIPVTYANSSPDVLGADHELSIGMVGTLGANRAANFAIQNSDLVLVLGCRLSPMTTGPEYTKFARSANVIVVDIDEVEHSKNTVKIDRLIISDVKKFLVELRLAKAQGASREWIEKCAHWKKVFPYCENRYRESEKVDLYYLAECLSEVLPEEAVLLSDAGLEELIMPSTVRFKAGQRCIHPVSQGSMGYALPAAVGAYYASGKTVVAVIGDGSIMMNLQELQTIRHNDIPIKILVVNNNAYSVIRKRQVDLFRSRTIGTDSSNGVSCPDFRKVAECFSIRYMKIEGTKELIEGLRIAMRSEGPLMCEIMAVEDQDYIRTAYAHNVDRRIVQRPLEDQAPFLDRKLFLDEMVIKPIDQ